jgi:hypothetical protein
MFLGDSGNLLSKYGDFKHFFPSNVVTLPFFPKKKIPLFVPGTLGFFFSLCSAKFAQKKKHWGERKIEIICI